MCLGTNSEGSHAWVMTVKAAGKVQFWESLTGSKLEQDDPRVHRFYRTVDSVFNHKGFFANIQSDNRVVNTQWDLQDEYQWKGMKQSYINMLPPSQGFGYIQPQNSIKDVGFEEKSLENLLRDKISSLRMNDEHL